MAEVCGLPRSRAVAVADGNTAEELPAKDKAYRRYASGVEKALLLFETVLEEWADYISFLNRLLKVRARLLAPSGPGYIF